MTGRGRWHSKECRPEQAVGLSYSFCAKIFGMNWKKIRHSLFIFPFLIVILFSPGCSGRKAVPYPSPPVSTERVSGQERKSQPNLLSLGKQYIEQENFSRAEESLQKALKADPSSAEIHYELGRVFSETDRNTEAEKEIKKALELSPGYAQAYSTLGNVYLHIKKFDDAKKSFEKAVSLDPKLVDAYIGLSSLYYASREYDRAAEILKKAENINPGEPYIYINMGLVRLRQGKVDAAETLFKKAIEVSESHGTAMLELADLYVYVRKYDKATPFMRHTRDWVKSPP